MPPSRPHPVSSAGGLNTGVYPPKLREAGSPKSGWQRVSPSEGARPQAASPPLQPRGSSRPAGRPGRRPVSASSSRGLLPGHASVRAQGPVFTRTQPYQTRPTLATSSSLDHLQTPHCQIKSPRTGARTSASPGGHSPPSTYRRFRGHLPSKLPLLISVLGPLPKNRTGSPLRRWWLRGPGGCEGPSRRGTSSVQKP